MAKSKKSQARFLTGAATSTLAVTAFVLMLLVTSATVYADNTARQNNNFTNPNWQNMHHYDYWNWRHNWAYQAPEYQFETTFPIDQWGRPTTSNVAAQRQQNVRRDRHAAFLPPAHGSQTGFFSGEFPTNQANPFAPRYNNNPNASRAVAIEESVFAVRPGEAGVNVRADGTHAGGFLASTSVAQVAGPSSSASAERPGQSGGGNSGNNAPYDGPAGTDNPPWTTPGNQGTLQGGNQGGFTVTHTPMPGTGTSQTGNQSSRITTVTPFSDGTIGRISIPALNRVALVRPGVELSTLDNYVGHFSNTSQWDGNIALASHNRGRGNFFASIWTLQHGDRIFYETTMGIRTFEVVSVTQISENDLTNLNHSHENTLTLVTCVYGQPSLRWSIIAHEVVQ